MSNISGNFFVNGNVEFNDRLKSVFGEIDSLVLNNDNRYKENEFQNSKHKLVVSTLKKNVKQYRGQESIFKKPENPKKKTFRISVPDYVKNPHKWIKYELGDYVITEKSNWEVAMKFHEELQTRKEAKRVEDVVSEPIKFKRQVMNEVPDGTIKEEKKYEYKDGKMMYPEYIVGQIPRKAVIFRKKPLNIDKSASSVKLDHLLHLDDELL